MARMRNKGGSGGVSSTQDYVTNKKKSYYNPAHQGIKLTSAQLEDYFSGATIECLECGTFYKNLSSHLCRSDHNLSKNDYCLKYGIPTGKALVAEYTSKKMSVSAVERVDEAFLERAALAMASGHRSVQEMKGKTELAKCPSCDSLVEANIIAARRQKGMVYCDKCRVEINRVNIRKSEERNRYREVYVCAFCQNSFETQNYNLHRKVKKGLPVYCSYSCASKKGNLERRKDTL